jgi:hypothetical protein
MCKIKIDSISLTLAAKNRSQKFNKRHKIGNCQLPILPKRWKSLPVEVA